MGGFVGGQTLTILLKAWQIQMESVICDEDAFLFDDPSSVKRPEKHLMYVPIYGAAAERLGTVLLVRFHAPFVVRDVLLAEYLGSLVGIEMLNDRNRTIEEHSRDRIAVQMAMAECGSVRPRHRLVRPRRGRA